MKEIEKILNENEKVLWEGSPNFWPFMLSGSIATSLFGLGTMVFLIPFMFFAIRDILFGSGVFGFGFFLMPHFWLGIGLLFGVPIYQYLVYKYTYYCITDKRAILQKGVIGRDFDIVDFDQVTNSQVDVGIFDKIFKPGDTGSIRIFTASGSTSGPVVRVNGVPIAKPYTFRNVQNPYEVFKFFKKVSFDVKSDIQYPNQLRPAQNPGYQSEYAPASQPVVNGQQV
jgi:Bacterial PH domain